MPSQIRPPPSPPPLLPLPIPLLFLVLLFSIAGVSFASDYACQERSTTCGDVTDITYPFWLANDPAELFTHCGYPEFMVICRNDTPILRLATDNYTVIHIDHDRRIISLADADIVGSADACPRVRHNLTFPPDSSLAYAPSDANLTFYFNCNVNLTEYISPCLGKKSFVLTDEMIDNNSFVPHNCEAVIVAPVRQEYLKSYQYELAHGFREALHEGFELNWSVSTNDTCSQCEQTGGWCGLNMTSSRTLVSACFCSDGRIASHNCSSAAGKGKKSTMKHGIIIGTVAGLTLGCFALLCLFLCVYILRSRKHHEKNETGVEGFLLRHGSLVPKRYKYSEIKRMTSSFSNKLGQGGYGTVFKGTLKDGHLVAVKVLSETKGNGEEFINEVASISRTSHVNIVSLLGFCLQGPKRALVYDFMPNGSLEQFIYADKSKTETQNLGWEKLYEIAVGVARGLEYLHRGCNTRIVHFDIKPHNILLDQDFHPKISDFGLAKICPPKVSVISMAAARGTFGYIAPEVVTRSIGAVSSKSDVYSYGMMLLEMAGGRKNLDAGVENTSEIYFPHWIYDNLNKYCEVGISGLTSETGEVARKMIMVGLWCIQLNPADRPSMSKVLEMWEGSSGKLEMPPRP
ncbi:LEAF RUST 10 DISEASE-RESISTANCE LOCUS RECEPTOR-LIKE PROTEIN KINASE-like 2.4 isoform X3 [Musa acuminata AAA Group]|uniref:LEAF RUST 10 DISEASE-RESISTANCE LOCUS RECEPTOR-LIKE PROTEIN KINASE-like 2.4 isoform X3 n=1 Tax=Musa acuminata AAA Group TaxID=214697 RepID=UPI0031D824BB